ncbi:MAG: glutamate racemase [Salibacteraceae bacterium]
MPAIGFFDSGVGGLSVWREVAGLLLNESTIYLADSANAPYGEKPIDFIIERSMKNTELLLKNDCKIIVVACNTATTNAIRILREKYAVPFIGIEPATKPAAIATKSGVIGILATKGTLASELFHNTSRHYRGKVKIIETVGENLVQIVESGNLEAARPLLKKYLQPMLDAEADSIVLGCTHYPFLIPIIKEIVPQNVQVIDSGLPVARQCKRVLEEQGLLEKSPQSTTHRFYTNHNLTILTQFCKLVGAHAECFQLDF